MEMENSRGYRHIEPPRSLQRRLRARGCSGSRFCTESPSYPTEVVDILVEVNSRLPTRIYKNFLKEQKSQKNILLFLDSGHLIRSFSLAICSFIFSVLSSVD